MNLKWTSLLYVSFWLYILTLTYFIWKYFSKAASSPNVIHQVIAEIILFHKGRMLKRFLEDNYEQTTFGVLSLVPRCERLLKPSDVTSGKSLIIEQKAFLFFSFIQSQFHQTFSFLAVISLSTVEFPAGDTRSIYKSLYLTLTSVYTKILLLILCSVRAVILRHSEADIHRRLQRLSAGADCRRGDPAALQVGTGDIQISAGCQADGRAIYLKEKLKVHSFTSDDDAAAEEWLDRWKVLKVK